MASISSANSIGNTSLRGYGGMASGIDRDSIIEKMTLGTTTKINNQKKKITQLQWKQEAYRNISDQIIDFGDKYTSFSSTNTLKDPNFFAKNIISIHGRDEATRFVTATGSSDLLSSISIKGVKQLATSTVRQSEGHYSADGLKTSLEDLNAEWRSSKLQGSQLIFEKKGNDGKTADRVVLTLPDAYEVEENGKKVTKKIDYTGDPEELVKQLNQSLSTAEIKIGDKKISEAFEFKYNAASQSVELNFKDMPAEYQIRGGSTALSALGYDTKDANGETQYLINVGDLKLKHSGKSFEDTGVNKPSALQEMTGKKLTFSYDGSKKDIELINAAEVEELQKLFTKEESKELAGLLKDKADGKTVDEDRIKELSEKKEAQLNKMAENLQGRLDRAYGKDMVKAEIKDGKFSFTTMNKESTVSIVSNDYGLLNNLGISYGESNKVNLYGKISQSSLLGKDAEKLPDGALDLKINGVAIEGITKDTAVGDILAKINSSKAGVKATYVDATGQFMLVSSETGAGRDITLDSEVAQKLFGATTDDGSGKQVYDPEKGVNKGQDAIICVSYGNGVDVDIKRASNSFNLEGLNVSVTGTFGGTYKKNEAGQFLDKDGNVLKDDDIANRVWNEDASQTVTFTAKSDVDAIVERVKGFFEDFNKLAGDINTEIITRPDTSYGPLTDEQKEEMDETSIENWEKKAKQGMLYGDSAMRDLSVDVQGIFLKLMNNVGFEKLKEMGITYSDDYNDGGTISFDEGKFRTAVESDSEAVANVFTGGGGVSKGLVDIMDETFTPYATRYASKNGNGGKGSYGRLIEIAGSEKKPTTLLNNQLYDEIEDIQDLIERLQDQLKGEQDRYISQFTTMESLLNKMNTQSSYLSQLSG